MKQQKLSLYSIGQSQVENVSGWAASVDALTITPKSLETHRNAQAYAMAMQKRAKDLGIRSHPAAMHGYQGWRAGSCQYMVKEGDAILQLTGLSAQDAIGMVGAWQSEISRLDLQVTVLFAKPYAGFAEEHRDFLQSHSDYPPIPANWKFVQSESGATIYFGSRRNNRYFRLYDKSGQMGGRLGESWRYEIELKGDTAKRHYPIVEQKDGLEQAIAEFVQAQFGTIAIRCPIPLQQTPSEMKTYPEYRGREDYLSWLKQTVQPVVRHLQNMGEYDKIVECLGLQPSLFGEGPQEGE